MNKNSPASTNALNRTIRVAFVGSRGIPAKYGGAETFVGEISQRLANKGFDVYVTCNSSTFTMDRYNGCTRLFSPSIEARTFTVPSINEIIATIHLLIRCPKIDLIYYLLDYGIPGAILPRLLGKKIVVCGDGIEWKRPLLRKRYLSPGLRPLAVALSWYLQLMEIMSVSLSHVIIADAMAIKEYLEKTRHAKNAVFIAYGSAPMQDSAIPIEEERAVLKNFGLTTRGYYFTAGRIVAENNIHVEIEGFKKSGSNKKLVIVGNFDDKDGYTKQLYKSCDHNDRIELVHAIYDKKILDTLRKNCFAYIHSYQVGGTNPSLLEQMRFGRPIIANDVPFHREILQEGGLFYKDEGNLAQTIDTIESSTPDINKIAECYNRRIEEEYNWDFVCNEYINLFHKLLS